MGSYFFVSIARADIFLGRVETLDSYRLPELLSGGTKNAQTAPLHHLAHHRIQKKTTFLISMLADFWKLETDRNN